MPRLILITALLAALLPGIAFAQSPSGGTRVVVDADGVLHADERVKNLLVIAADAYVDGEITGTLLVIDGDAYITGTVGDNITVISGDIHLLDAATVKNVYSFRGEILRDAGATVTGDVESRSFSGFWAAIGVFSVFFWVGMTIALIVAGILFALIGGRQLTAAAGVMTGELVNAIVGAVFLWVGVPILAVIAIITVVGLPLGLGVLIFLLPVLGFLGYLVAATRIGTLVTSALKQETGRPVLAVILGVLILQVALLIPVAGAIAVFLAALWGAGSLAYVAYRSAGGRDITPPEAGSPASAA